MTLNDEVSVSADFLGPKPQHFNYDIYGGVSYTIHVGRPKGQRVSNMMIQGHEVDLKQTYTICVNNYRAVGGGQMNNVDRRASCERYSSRRRTITY